MIRLHLPFAHRVLGYLHSPSGHEYVLVEKVDAHPQDMPYVTYEVQPCHPLLEKDEWQCEAGHYCQSLMMGQVDLVKRAGWWS